MHDIQKQLLSLTRNVNLGEKSLREIGNLIGVDHPQKISHHLLQLEKKGFIQIDRSNNLIKNSNSNPSNEYSFVNVPIVGAANCGPAQLLADENIEGHLKVSKSIAKNRRLFAVRAVGNSMNRSNINGKSIEEGDYVLVDSESTTPEHGAYSLFVLDGAANIKRFHLNSKSGEILLISESTQEFPPISIHPSDSDHFLVNGKIVDVVKQVKF